MKLTHSFVVQAPLDRAWETITDLTTVVPCFPGATLDSLEGDEFVGSCAIKLGPISLAYRGTGRFRDLDAAGHRLAVEATGKDRRGNGTASAELTAVLSPIGDTATAVEVVTDLALTGKAGQFGRGVVQDVSDRLLQQFAEQLAKSMALGPTAPPDPSAENPHLRVAAAPRSRAAQPPAALNLGSALAPVLAARLAPVLAVGIVLLWWRRRNRSRRRKNHPRTPGTR
ncbi:MAG: hypothetical protein JWO11_4417 [Nocardioides sp.]|nr:hypothetical protein [Nocardioides sp.]